MTDTIQERINQYLKDTIAAERNFEHALATFGKAGEQTPVQSMLSAASAKAKTQHARLEALLAKWGGTPSEGKTLLAEMLAFTPLSAQIGQGAAEKNTQHLMVTFAAAAAEPDALAMADCLSGDQRQERYDLIHYAVDALTRNPATAVYVDGGHVRWHSAEDMADRLNKAGVGHARGFSLNVANFFTTEDETGYGEAISAHTNGSHYVIDTSRNGAGPAPASKLDWCNPGGRALGTPPTTATGGGHADAYLWIKRPGESDGSCDKGDPPAGTFVNQYVVDLARNGGPVDLARSAGH